MGEEIERIALEYARARLAAWRTPAAVAADGQERALLAPSRSP
jgi:hypothetical protein